MEKVTPCYSTYQPWFRSNLCIRLSLAGSPQRTSMHIICAYLPSSDHTIEEYRKYVGDLVSIISTLEPYGPLILVGDLNAHLNAPTNKQGDLVFEAIRNCNLFIASSSCIAKGPCYTPTGKLSWIIYLSAPPLATQ